MNIKKNIPNTLTLGNLVCGCLALVKAMEGDLIWAAYLVGIAALFDFLDGFAARMLKVSSAIGKDLDSLADMVTFGVVPGAIMMMLIRQSLLFENANGISSGFIPFISLAHLPYIGFIITVFSCIRLAMFNNDTRQTSDFIGLPTPANAIFVCSLPLLINLDHGFSFQRTDARLVTMVLNSANLCILTGFLSLLLVSEFSLFSLKFKNVSWTDNRIRYIFLAIALALILTLKASGITIIMVVYVLLGFLNNIFLKKEV